MTMPIPPLNLSNTKQTSNKATSGDAYSGGLSFNQASKNEKWLYLAGGIAGVFLLQYLMKKGR